MTSKIHKTAIINSSAEIGTNVVIGPYSVIHETNLNTYVKILDNNIIREYVSIHRSTEEGKPTKIFCNTMIMANSHIGHDCIVGDNVIITNATLLAGKVMIEEYAVLGGNTLVHQHVRIGKLSMVSGALRRAFGWF